MFEISRVKYIFAIVYIYYRSDWKAEKGFKVVSRCKSTMLLWKSSP